MNMNNEYLKFSKKSKDSKIIQWMNGQNVMKPSESRTVIRSGGVFIGNYPSANYTGPAVIIYSSDIEFTKCYVGFFKNGKRHGKGWRRLNNELFIGSYMNNKKHGDARILQFPERETTFNGKYRSGLMHGQCYIKNEEFLNI